MRSIDMPMSVIAESTPKANATRTSIPPRNASAASSPAATTVMTAPQNAAKTSPQGSFSIHVDFLSVPVDMIYTPTAALLAPALHQLSIRGHFATFC